MTFQTSDIVYSVSGHHFHHQWSLPDTVNMTEPNAQWLLALQASEASPVSMPMTLLPLTTVTVDSNICGHQDGLQCQWRALIQSIHANNSTNGHRPPFNLMPAAASITSQRHPHCRQDISVAQWLIFWASIAQIHYPLAFLPIVTDPSSRSQ